MKDQGALNASLCQNRDSPLRSQSRYWRHSNRQHPYRREKSQHIASAVHSNGSSNGTTATLTNGIVRSIHKQPPSPQAAQMMDLMEQVASGSVDPEMAANYVQQLMNTTQVLREVKIEDKAWGEENMPQEIVWAPGKTSSQLVVALQRIVQTGCAAIAVRVPSKMAEEVLGLVPEAKFNEVAQILSITPTTSKSIQRLPGTVAIIADSTAEDRVIQETVTALQIQGCYAYKLAGSGGPNSLPNLSAADSASVVIVMADGQGPLASVVASSITPPVVVVPTVEAKVANSPGLTHVDFNNGLAAAIIAARILRTMARMQLPRKS